jgi:hypothetical protein
MKLIPALTTAALALALASCGQNATTGILQDQAALDAALNVRTLELPCESGQSNAYLSSWSCITVDETANTATVTFTVRPDQNVKLTLVSYKAPTATWDPDLVEQQVYFASKTETFGPGTHTITISVPDCYFQVDFITGDKIIHLTPENDYRVESGLIQDKWGGGYSCFTTEGEGCTPGYWKNHTESWVGRAPTDLTSAVFNVTYGTNLLAALGTGGGQEKALMRHAVAALLNAESEDVDYEFTTEQVLQMVADAFMSKDYEATKDLLADQNEMGCPLN